MEPNVEFVEEQVRQGEDWYHLPMEIWEPILLSLESSMDIINLISVFPELEAILIGRKQSILIDQAFRLICTYLSKADTLACRSVDKRWNTAVDNLISLSGRFEFPSFRFLQPGNQSLKNIKNWRTETMKMEKNVNIDRDFSLIHFGQSCTIKYNFRRTIENRSIAFFETFGGKIRAIRLLLECDSLFECLSLLARVLRLCPNLEMLDLGLFATGRPIPWLRRIHRNQLTADWIPQLKPVWPKSLRHVAITSTALRHEVVKGVCLTLCNDKFDYNSRFTYGDCVEFTQSENSTKKLKIQSIVSVGQLEEALRLEMPLTHLLLDISMSVFKKTTYGDVMPMLLIGVQNFKGSLHSLKLHFSHSRQQQYLWNEMVVLDMPMLKVLSLRNYPLGSLNPFSNLNGLEYFLLQDEYSSADMLQRQEAMEELDIRETSIASLASYHQFHFSNIWTRFKKLRELSFNVRVFRRDTAEKHVANCTKDSCQYFLKQ